MLKCTADGELRICAPVSDAINGQFDESVKMLLGLGGESDQKGLTVEMNRCPLVPVVLVFTKLDVIFPRAVHRFFPNDSNIARRNYESVWAAASAKCDEFRRSPFENVRAEIVSSNYSFVYITRKGHLTPSFILSTVRVPQFYRQAGCNNR